MEGINILATKLILDYGVGMVWMLLIGLLVFLFGLFCLFKWDNAYGLVPALIGVGLSITSLIVILSPVTAHIATIEDDVPYKYIEEHYRIKDKTDNLYTLIPLEEKK